MEKKIIKAVNIKYDTDGQKVHLPTSLDIEIPEDMDEEDIEEFISGEISDRTGWCHFGFDTIPELSTKESIPETNFEIKITGSGTRKEIANALREVANALYHPTSNGYGYNHTINSKAEWEDHNLMTEITEQ